MKANLTAQKIAPHSHTIAIRPRKRGIPLSHEAGSGRCAFMGLLGQDSLDSWYTRSVKGRPCSNVKITASTCIMRQVLFVVICRQNPDYLCRSNPNLDAYVTAWCRHWHLLVYPSTSRHRLRQKPHRGTSHRIRSRDGTTHPGQPASKPGTHPGSHSHCHQQRRIHKSNREHGATPIQ